jgi:hypothetical protein
MMISYRLSVVSCDTQVPYPVATPTPLPPAPPANLPVVRVMQSIC